MAGRASSRRGIKRKDPVVDPESVTETIGAFTPEFTSDALRQAVLALRAPQAAKRAPAPTSSVFGRAAAAVPGDAHPPTPRTTLQGRFRSVETSALLPGTSMALVVLPAANGIIPAQLMRSCEMMVNAGATVVMLGPDIPRQVSDARRPLTIPLRADDSLADEWGLIACGPARRVAFLARREPVVDDVWSWIVTRDAVAVHRAGTAILERVPFLKLRVPALAT
jgi:hypothetical protein